jgi:ribosomal protein S18 acetylase RimI-like enzyme
METRAVLQECDVGHRVVVRRRVGERAMTDLLGVLVALDADRVVVRAEDGEVHSLAAADVVAGKRVPPRPARYSEIDALERTADRCWPAPVHERLGDWYLRAAQGWTNRANSALPLGNAGLPMAEALEATQVWYAGQGLTPRITVPLPLRRDVAEALATAGWSAQPRVLVQTAPLDAIRAPDATGSAGSDVALLERPSDGFLSLVAARKQSLPQAAMQILLGTPEVRFAHRYSGADGRSARSRAEAELVGIARGAVADGVLHLSVVEVVESARRAGIASDLSRALAAWGRSAGAVRAMLQVEERNTGAVALYGGLGFTTHHSYITFAFVQDQRMDTGIDGA